MTDKYMKLFKISAISLLVIVFIIAMITPLIGSANTQTSSTQILEMQKRIAELQKQQENSEKKSKQIKQGINTTKVQERNTLSEIKKIENEIDTKDKDLQNLALQIEEMELQVNVTELELQEAENRVASRDQVLKSRVRSMYEDGKVSYLEVLLGATNFADFLNRFEALNLIVEQDFRILKENQQDRELINDKKIELEQHVVYLESLYSQTESIIAQLTEQERKQQVQLSSLNKDIVQLEKQLKEEEEAQKQLIAELNKTIQQFQRIYAGTGVFGWPLDKMQVTSPYGNRKNPFGTGKTEWHNGVDFRASVGTPIYAAEDGVVVLSGWVRGFGWTVILDHGSQITSLYAHNNQLVAQSGQTVKRGQTISKAGASGNVTGPHLHFTIYENGKDVDPSKYVKW